MSVQIMDVIHAFGVNVVGIGEYGHNLPARIMGMNIAKHTVLVRPTPLRIGR